MQGGPAMPYSARSRSMFAALLMVAAVLVTAERSSAQVGSMFNQRDDQYRVLGLKRAKEAYETARKDYDRQKMLFEKNLISQSDLDRAHNQFADAEVNYQQSLLAVLFEQQYVTVVKAVKYQGRDRTKHVRLTVANASGGSAEFRKLLNIDDPLFRSLQPDIINDVYISLLNGDGAVIGQPYEAKIDELRFGTPVQIDFSLLQDLDVATVNMIYGKGTTRALKVYLQKDVSENTVAVQSQQFSQEGELGSSATFDLTLELFSGSSTTFSLEVVNLPAQLNRYFTDPVSNARLSQFKFTESVTARKASLVVWLPDRPTETVLIDKPIEFYVLVTPTERAAELKQATSHQWTEDEIARLKVGYVKLGLVPRGKGKLLVRAQQLFESTTAGGTVQTTMDVVNEGSRRLDNIEVNADVPLNWTKSIEPRVITSLGPGEERRVQVSFGTPRDVSVGRYEMRIRTASLSDNTPVNAEDKTVTVEVQAEANILGTVLLILLILGLVAGMVVFGVRLSRK